MLIETIAITIVLIIMASITIYLLIKRYVKKLIAGSIKNHTQISKVIQEIVEEVNALIVEFNGITDRNVTIVEDKIARLSSLVEQSRHAITILSTYSFDSIDSTQTNASTAPKSAPRAHQLLSTHDVHGASPEIDDHTRDSGNYSVSTVLQGRSTTIQTGHQQQDIVSHIKRLHRQQTDIATIAKQVGIPISEVETYISLFNVD